ncbi:piggyBac transposable element-derived protein 3-like [Portunus trituberculatus]|uniref:piggyBac transposable element-derived protein 3-like n=1 Tax=Portunus trituberculatus TaxID=210409 RepID=UPI001E1CCF9D|nr:piggyBac transposable element-derived protein 3-like [Portunus trituberculatus]
MDDVKDLYIEPPDVSNLTDEDSGPEDEGTVFHPESLSGNQLLAPAEFRASRREEDEEEEEDEESLVEQNETRKKPTRKKRKVSETFAKIKWGKNKGTAAQAGFFPEVNCISGYNSLPSQSMYWSYDPDLHNKAICDAMRRDRFDPIKKCLHFNASTDQDKNDKYTKLRPLITHLQEKFMEHFIPSQCISHDEAMVKYFGKHGCKQSIRNKPIRFGYKIWCQNTTSGYLLAFDPYQGKTYKGDENMESDLGKAASTVMHLIGGVMQEGSAWVRTVNL